MTEELNHAVPAAEGNALTADSVDIYCSLSSQMLLDNIPGSVLQCRNDDCYTIIRVNEGFLNMFGYTADELGALFHGRFAEMIHPDDRESTRKELDNQLRSGGAPSLTYRVLCKDGRYKWVLENCRLADGENGRLFYCVMADITVLRETREDLRLSLERHQIIMDQTTDIIFEWDIRCDTIIYSTNWKKKFGYDPIADQVSDQMPVTPHIHRDDIAAFLHLMEESRRGEAYSTAEFRIQKADGQYIWCRIRATDLYDEEGQPIKAVGVITDIDKEKQMIDDLRRRAERDALTGLYNRQLTESLIEHYLDSCKSDELCALIMVDMDNFKTINDSKGHLFGDAVLSEMSDGMRKLTRSSDIIGRIGGDEFAIFLKAVPSEEFVRQRVEQLLAMFRQLKIGDSDAASATCSMGVAFSPRNGREFGRLYHCADLALYQAKNLGKNRFVLYEDSAVSREELSPSTLGAGIDSDRQSTGISQELAGYVFEILYETDDLEKAINLILEIVGKRFGVSRAYIFENSDDNQFSSNTFEWCNDSICPEKDSLQHMRYETLANYEGQFGPDGIFYCRDVQKLPREQRLLLEAQGIRSLLQCAIQEKGTFRGFVGFDECTGLRLWTQEEVGALTMISRLLSTFLLKRRAQDRDRETTCRMESILDAQQAYIYVVDRESYALLYLNQKTKALDSRAGAGLQCHKAFFDKETPCEHCPIRNLKNGEHTSSEFYNPQYRLWTLAHAAPLHWNDSDAYLVSCYDITAYKMLPEDP